MKSYLTASTTALALLFAVACAETPAPAPRKTNVGSGNVVVEPDPDPSVSGPTTPVSPVPSNPTPNQIPSQVTPQNPTVPQPSTPSVSNGKPLDLVASIDTTSYYLKVGQLSGWAGNKNDTTNYLEVKFYLDGDNKTGKSVGTAKANLVGSDAGLDGDHAFIFDIPVTYKDGKPHKVYAYVTHDGAEVILGANYPLTLTFYQPKGGAAKAAYDKVGFETNCQGCHSFNYENRWESLSAESTASKWTRDNNYLYNKVVSGHRANVGGKTPCNVKNFNCEAIKTWWDLEFGP